MEDGVRSFKPWQAHTTPLYDWRNSQKIAISRIMRFVFVIWGGILLSTARDIVSSNPSPKLWHKHNQAACRGFSPLPMASGMCGYAGEQQELVNDGIHNFQPANESNNSLCWFFFFPLWQSPHRSEEENLIFSKTSVLFFPLKMLSLLERLAAVLAYSVPFPHFGPNSLKVLKAFTVHS